MTDALDGAVRWLFVALAGALAGFALLALDLIDLAVLVGVATSLVFAVAGLRVSSALSDRAEDERIDYPYHVAQRGRRLAASALVTAAGLAGYGFAPRALEASMGALVLVLAGGAAFLGPVLTVVLALWVIDGVALVAGPGGVQLPLTGAALSLTAGLALALGAATAGFPANLLVLALLGGVVPAAFLLWGTKRLASSLDEPGPPA